MIPRKGKRDDDFHTPLSNPLAVLEHRALTVQQTVAHRQDIASCREALNAGNDVISVWSIGSHCKGRVS